MRDLRISPHGDDEGIFDPDEIVDGGIKMIRDYGRAYIYLYTTRNVYYRIKEKHVAEILRNFKGTFKYKISNDGRFKHVYAEPETKSPTL